MNELSAGNNSGIPPASGANGRANVLASANGLLLTNRSRCGYPGQGKIVMTTVTLPEFRETFMGTSTFLSRPCWQAVTHLVIKDFLAIDSNTGKIGVAGSADRFGWQLYKSLLRKLVEQYSHLTLLFEFFSTIDRDLLLGATKFPCCELNRYLNEEFPQGQIGLSLRVMNYMSLINLDSGLGASLTCFRANTNFDVWINLENPHFRLTKEQMVFFDGMVATYDPLVIRRHPKTVLKVLDGRSDAKVAYLEYAGMLVKPIFNDFADALMLRYDTVDHSHLMNVSQLNTCLHEWAMLERSNPRAPCARCGKPKSTCAVQSSAPGSCSTETGRLGRMLAASVVDDDDLQEIAGMVFVLDE